jgi:large subunit ribosomal protein L17
MRHRNSGRKFDRDTSSRRAMLRLLTANLVLHERIETTDAKAKEVRRVAEKLITKARRLGDVAYTTHDKLDAKARVRRLAVERQISAYIPKPFAVKEVDGVAKKVNLVEKVLVELSKRFKDRPGGYTRIIKFGPRRGDGAPMVGLELVEGENEGEATEGDEKKPKKKKAKKAAAKGAEEAPAKAE